MSSQLFWLSVHFVINMKHPCTPGVFSDINSKSYEELLMMHLRRIHEASDSGPCVGYHGCPCPNKCKFLRGRSCCNTCSRLSNLEKRVALLEGALQFPLPKNQCGVPLMKHLHGGWVDNDVPQLPQIPQTTERWLRPKAAWKVQNRKLPYDTV